MSYLDENLNCLKENRQNLYKFIKKYIEEKDYDFSRFRTVEAKNGQKVIEMIIEKKWVRLNSIYNPKIQAEKWAKKIEFKNLDESIIMFGLADGAYAMALLKKMNEDTIMIVEEPDRDLFFYCLNEFDMKKIISDKRIYLSIDRINDYEFSYALTDIISAMMMSSMIVCIYPNMDKIYKEKAEKFKENIIHIFRESKSKYLNSLLFENSEMNNTLKNLHFINGSSFSTDFIGKIPTDIPFIVVAAGPSLDKNVDELKRAEGKAFIMATDRAVACLVEHNINFDAIITLDSAKDVKYLSDSRCLKYPIFTGLDCQNGMLELNKGRKIWIFTSAFLIRLSKIHDIDIKTFSVGGSVATAAFNVARMMKSEHIVLIGQDLAYSGNASHAGGVSEENKFNDCDEYVEGIDGNKVKTRLDWIRYLKWFEKTIKGLEDGIEVIDATEGGAKIAGTKIMKLSEVIDKYCKKEFCFADIVKNTKPSFSERQYLAVREDLIHMEKELDIIKYSAQRGIEASNMILDGLEKEINFDKENCIMVIKNMNIIIEEQLVYFLIKNYIRSYSYDIMKTANCLDEDEDENLKKTCMLSRNMYEIIIAAVKDITPKLHKALKKV